MPPSMLEEANLANFSLKIDGQQVSDLEAGSISEIRVDMAIGGSDMITIVVVDWDLEKLETVSSEMLGKTVEVGLGYTLDLSTLATGNIVSLEAALLASGQHTVTIRALNKMSLLRHGRKTRTFLNTKDSDIASSIAQECGLSADTDATESTIPYVVQWNQTNMEFLQERARRIGYVVSANSQKLFFKKDQNEGQAVAEFAVGESLISFRPRVSLAQQVAKVKVLGWDPKQKQEISGESSSPNSITQGGDSSSPNSIASSKLGSTLELSVIDHEIATPSEASTQATALLTEIGRSFYEGELQVEGNTELVPGVLVKIAGAGSAFSGNYHVFTATHLLTGGMYSTTLGITATNNDRVDRILNGSSEGKKVLGVFPGLVSNLQDPDGKGRIKVEFPMMPTNQGQKLESDWMRLAAPMAGNGRGLMLIPEVGDEVLVVFEGGNPHRGYIIGSLWGGDSVPYSAYHDNGVPTTRGLKTTSGHELTFSDKSGEETITLKDKAGNTLLFDAANQLIKFTAVKDMEFDIQGNLKVKTSGNISLESTGTFGIKSTGALNIEGTQAVTVKATTTLTLEGTTKAEVKASGSLSLTSTGIAELKGSLVKIN